MRKIVISTAMSILLLLPIVSSAAAIPYACQFRQENLFRPVPQTMQLKRTSLEMAQLVAREAVTIGQMIHDKSGTRDLDDEQIEACFGEANVVLDGTSLGDAVDLLHTRWRVFRSAPNGVSLERVMQAVKNVAVVSDTM